MLLFLVFYAPVSHNWCSRELPGTLPLFQSLKSVGLFLAGHGFVAGYERWYLQLHTSRSPYFTILCLSQHCLTLWSFHLLLTFLADCGGSSGSCEATSSLLLSLTVFHMLSTLPCAGHSELLSAKVPEWPWSCAGSWMCDAPDAASYHSLSTLSEPGRATSSHMWSSKLWAIAAWDFSFPNCCACRSTDPTDKIMPSWKITFSFWFPVFGLNCSYILEFNSFSQHINTCRQDWISGTHFLPYVHFKWQHHRNVPELWTLCQSLYWKVTSLILQASRNAGDKPLSV